MSDNTLETTDNTVETETTQETQAKTYTQDEFNSHMAKLRTSMERKFAKQMEELGDIEELKSLRKAQSEQKQADALSRGEFESVLKEHLSKKDVEIQKRDEIIRNYKIDMPIVTSAAKHKAINAEQVKSLVKNNLRLNNDGEVEVLDTTGKVRYNDRGDLFSVDELVKEFLDTNPHFVAPTLSTTNTKSNFTNKNTGFDINNFDPRDPEQRKKYYAARKK